MSIENKLKNLDFKPSLVVEGRSSIADLYSKDTRCGIYVLHFKNNAYYVGQAVDVVRRYAQHCHNHQDIVRISFKLIQKDYLDNEERRIIYALENAGYKLRNISLVELPNVETDFDLIMSQEDQRLWQHDLSFLDLAGDRIVNQDLRSRYHKRYEQFITIPQAQKAINVLRQYVQTCLPAVKRSEVSFWSCSCMPYHGSTPMLRLNVGWQTVFDVFANEYDISCRWYLTRNMTRQALGRLHTAFWLEKSDSGLIAGGGDQITFMTTGYDQTCKYLRNQNLILALRKFNLGLMKKGPTPWGRNHCLDLADHLIESVNK